MTWTRLRQIALVSEDRDATVAELHSAFGLEVAFNDPGVATFGLHNAVLPVGTQFIEVVAPTREGTAAGRQMERMRGPGGYMVICHTDDHDALRGRLEPLGVRVALEADDHGYRILQLHPADTGGSFLEVDYQPGGEDPNGPWSPAGPDWQKAIRTQIVDGIDGVTIQSADPERTAARWSALLDIPEVDMSIHLDNAVVHIVEGSIESLVGVSLTGPEAFEPRTICGVRFTRTGG